MLIRARSRNSNERTPSKCRLIQVVTGIERKYFLRVSVASMSMPRCKFFSSPKSNGPSAAHLNFTKLSNSSRPTTTPVTTVTVTQPPDDPSKIRKTIIEVGLSQSGCRGFYRARIPRRRQRGASARQHRPIGIASRRRKTECSRHHRFQVGQGPWRCRNMVTHEDRILSSAVGGLSSCRRRHVSTAARKDRRPFGIHRERHRCGSVGCLIA